MRESLAGQPEGWPLIYRLRVQRQRAAGSAPTHTCLRRFVVFKEIKQYLSVKLFVGGSKNAVSTQLWVATCMHLLLAYLKSSCRCVGSCTECYGFSQLNLFDRRSLPELFMPPSPPGTPNSQMLLWS